MIDTLSLNAYSYNNVITGSSGKVYVPVTPAAVIYSQFEHVSGFASPDRSRGISVSKIQILNSLLNQLITMKNQPKVEMNGDDFQSEEQMDSMIQYYQEQLQNEISKSGSSGYGLAGAAVQPGMIFNIEA